MRPHVASWLASWTSPRLADALAPTWFTCVGFAGLAALVLFVTLARRRAIDPATAVSIAIGGYLAAVAAGIVMPLAIDVVEHFAATGRVRLHWAGMTSFWGYLAGAATVAIICRRHGVALARVGDVAVIPIGAALVLARIGCFLAGCDYGRPSSLPWAVHFPAGSPAWRDQIRAGVISADSAESLAVHPTELYEALLGVAIVALGVFAARRMRRDGELFLLAAATYAFGRVDIEMLRGDAGRGLYFGISSGQIFCALVLAAIAFAIARRARAVPITS